MIARQFAYLDGRVVWDQTADTGDALPVLTIAEEIRRVADEDGRFPASTVGTVAVLPGERAIVHAAGYEGSPFHVRFGENRPTLGEFADGEEA